MQQQFVKIKALHKTLLLLQVITALLFLAVVYLQKNTNALMGNNPTLQVVFLCVAVACHFGGKHFFNQHIKKAKLATTPLAKLQLYKKGALMQWALLTNASILAAICFFITYNLAYLGVAALIALYFFLLQPNKIKLGFYLGITF
jgi:hypothetical protein